MERYINMHMYGDNQHSGHSGQWQFPWSEDKKLVEKVTMSNCVACSFIYDFDALITLLILDSNPCQKTWLDAVSVYKKVVLAARSWAELSDNDIESDLSDEFFEMWIKLHGKKGFTNYFHMIGAGHLKY